MALMFDVDDLARAARSAPVRLRAELTPPPPDEAREWNPVPCLGCGRIKTWHTSGRCYRCGGWITTVDAAHVQPGDLLLHCRQWVTVEAVAFTTDQHGDPVRRLRLDTGDTIQTRLDAGCTIATNAQRTTP